MSFNVAIDGPAGAGKSTIAKNAARSKGFIYMDTGAMYRAIGLYFLEQGLDIHDEGACTGALEPITVSIRYVDGQQQVILNGEDVSGKIRTPEVSEAASVTSAYGAVRAKLLDLQRELAKKENVLMDGRDIGTTVLPKAQLKVYLTASSDVRAKRRMEEYLKKGMTADFETIKTEIEERDYRDMHREASPLKKAEDAVVVDSSDLSIEEVTAVIISLIEERMTYED